MLYSLKTVPPLRKLKHAPRNFAATQSCAQCIALIAGAEVDFCLVRQQLASSKSAREGADQ